MSTPIPEHEMSPLYRLLETIRAHVAARPRRSFIASGPANGRIRLRVEAVRVWLFNAGLAALAVVGYVAVVRWLPTPSRPVEVPWLALAAGFAAAELKTIQVHYRRETHSFSLSEIPAVIGLFFVSPNEYLSAMLVGSGVVLVLAARQSMVKVAFNIANFALIGVIELGVFTLAGAIHGPPSLPEWLATFGAMLAACGVGALTIATAISLSGGAPQYQKLPEMLRFGGMVALANTSLALLAVSVMWVNTAAIWLLIVPLIVVFLAYGAYVSEREKHERLELLYQSSRILQHSPQLDAALVALLDHARNMFRAEIAEVVLYARDALAADVRTTSTHDAPPVAMAPAGAAAVPDRERLLRDRHALLAGPPVVLDGGRHVREAMVAPLTGDAGPLGAMIVANRLTEGTSFDGDDLRLLETLANQAAVALENGQLEQSLAELSRLKEELRHQAYHDPLTGLPNRVMLSSAVDDRLRGPGTDDAVVLFLDLDDFKFVNDSFGHAAGDGLLVAVADRVTRSIRADDVAARLGGDEFAILLGPRAGLGRAADVANRIIAALQAPFAVQGEDIVVGCSIGIASARAGIGRRDELLRNADVAMYTAKAAGKRRVAIFDPTMHAAIVARQALSADLSRSLGRGELAVAYQPIVELSSGRIVAVEALVRWRHPVRGLVPPDEFIPVAEENGLILALGRWVAAEACAQAAAWLRASPADGPAISVNVSPVQIKQPEFIAEIEAILASTGLPPERLIIELTESAMFQDSHATIAKLDHLRGLGVRIALDDFGTGYSSLGYLHRFPVDILKIARDFVVDADADMSDWAFAHAIVTLGHTLGLWIVAEGIEQAGQAERLNALGCQYGQGFHLGRPVDADTIGLAIGGAAPPMLVAPSEPALVAAPTLSALA